MNVLAFSKRHFLFLVFTFLLFVVAFQVVSAERTTLSSSTQTQQETPDWLEPLGINLATLTGLLPESTLKDAVLVWIPGSGTVKYDSGVENGNEIEVTVRYNLKNKNEVWCLGEPPQFDHSGTVQPASTMRVYSDGNDVTSRIQSSYEHILGGVIQPVNNASTFGSRYTTTDATAQFSADGSVIVPANRGCRFRLDAELPNVTAVFTMARQDKISITEVYHHVNTEIHSYIGHGAPGSLASLQAQMLDAYGTRHDPIVSWRDGLSQDQKDLIETSDYTFVKFPAASYDMYGGTDSYGTYRFAFNTGSYEWLSVDHISGKLIPRLGHWRDADTQGDQALLDYFQAMWGHGENEFDNIDTIKSAELFLPPGLDFQPCMEDGGCSADVLQEIYDHTYTAEVFFYKVERIRDGGLEQVPLLSVGNGFVPQPRQNTAVSSDQTAQTELMDHFVYIPIVRKPTAPPPDDQPAVCPGSCGWFDQDGQMLDFVPPVTWNFP